MRRTLGITLLLVLIGTAAAIAVMPAASGQTEVHVVMQLPVRIETVDRHKDGLGLGDRVAARAPLLDASQSETVGTGYGQCVVHRRIFGEDRGLWNCNYILELAEGDLVIQGLDPRGPGEYAMAVLGGTGAFADATGDATFTDVGVDGDGYTDMVIRLEP